MQGGGWAADIKRALGWLALAEYLELWNILADVNLDDSYDVHQWKFEASGIFSTSSAYCSYFVGSIPFEPWRKVWKSWATGKCKTFMWLAIKNWCWTADRLRKRGLPHPERCPLCDQEEENIQHIITYCVFARQFWFAILQPLNLAELTPTRSSAFAVWWRRAEKRIQKLYMKGFNSLCILGAWTLWKHRNACIFDGASPNIPRALQDFKTESYLWQSSSAKGLTALNLDGARANIVVGRSGLVRCCIYFSIVRS